MEATGEAWSDAGAVPAGGRRIAHKASVPPSGAAKATADLAEDQASRLKAYQDKKKAIEKKQMDQKKRQEFFEREKAQADAARATQERLEAAARDRAQKMAEMEAEMQAVKMRMANRDATWSEQGKKEAERAEAERIAAERAEAERLEAERQHEEEQKRLAKVARDEAARRKVEAEAAALRAAELERQRWEDKEAAAAQQTFKPGKKGTFDQPESIPEDAVADLGPDPARIAMEEAAAELAAVKRAYQACEKRVQTLKAESAPPEKLRAAIEELKEIKPRLKQLSAMNRISKLQDIPERKDGVVQVVGSRASELSARRLQRQRAREAHRGSAAMTHQVDREANRFFT